MYSPSIARKEITMSRKMWFVKMSEIRDAEWPVCCEMLFRPLNARKNAEN
jgi:hypothetical protein